MTTVSILLQAAQGGGLSGILMIVAMIAIFYFFMIRPQQKKQKELKKQRESMGKGDKVITAGGIHGKLKEVNNGVARVQIAEGVTIEISIESVYPVVEQQPKKK